MSLSYEEENPFDDTDTHTAVSHSPASTSHEQLDSPSTNGAPGYSEPATTNGTAQQYAPVVEEEENPFESASSVPHDDLLSLDGVDASGSTSDPPGLTSLLGKEVLPPNWRTEFKILLDLAMPAVLVNLLFVSMSTGSQMLVGHISSEALAAAVCANMLYNMLWFFLFGFAGALDTLASQSHGAGSQHGVNLWTKRAIVLVSILTIPTVIPIFFSYDIMRSILGQPEAVAVAAQTYCRWLCLGMWPFNMTIVLQVSRS